ncbi:MAG: (Fe-S)-binding protein, partial [Clostridia bacterium]|nr:(Fe-S)-binding protein [Clostridia bacterium]
PSMHIEHGKGFAERLATIKETLTANGVKNIYTICPNCYVTLLEHTDFNVKSAWSFLDGHLPKESQDSLKGRVLSIHDPCPIVKDIEAAHHVRNILQQLGAEIVEFDKNRENTMCCGKKNMIMALNPEKGKKIFHVRAKQLKTDEVATYCAACVDSFRDHDFTAHHVLELVFQMNATTSWINRYKAVGALKREV